MTPPGHLAAAYLLVRQSAAPARSWQIASAWFGAMLPDLSDKPLQWLGFTPYGRTVGHSVLVWAGLALVWLVVRRAQSSHLPGLVLLGAASHLVVDLVDDVAEGLERTGYVFSGWFAWPFTNPDMWNTTSPHVLERVPNAVTTLELATVVACLWHLARGSAPSRLGAAR